MASARSTDDSSPVDARWASTGELNTSGGGVPRGLHASERDQEPDEELAPTFFADDESEPEEPPVDDADFEESEEPLGAESLCDGESELEELLRESVA